MNTEQKCCDRCRATVGEYFHISSYCQEPDCPNCHTEQKCCMFCSRETLYDDTGAPNCTDVKCSCHHTEQKGWRDTSSLAEDLHGRIARSWGNTEDVRSEIEDFIERTLQAQREEMVRRIEGLLDDTQIERAQGPMDDETRSLQIQAIIKNVTIRHIIALIKDTEI